MARPSPLIRLNAEEQTLLKNLSRSRELPHGLVQRASMILRSHEGETNKAIAFDMGLCEETVSLWRRRWQSSSEKLSQLEGKRLSDEVYKLLSDKERPGTPTTFTPEQICHVMAIACEKPPEHISHWSRSELARTMKERGIVKRISATTIGRFLKSGRPKAT